VGDQIVAVSRLLLVNPGTKSHSDVGVTGAAENIIWGKVMASLKFGPW